MFNPSTMPIAPTIDSPPTEQPVQDPTVAPPPDFETPPHEEPFKLPQRPLEDPRPKA